MIRRLFNRLFGRRGDPRGFPFDELSAEDRRRMAERLMARYAS